VAICGLGGHAYGSFKERDSPYMWLRDSLPGDMPKCRILTYGYESKLVNSRSFQSLEDIASQFKASLNLIRSLNSSGSSSDRDGTKLGEIPLILIAHSLGGLVAKEVIPTS
jgi:protein SERAC1